MKNDEKISFTVRLNLNNPRHQEAWELLQNSSASYVATIVDALIVFKQNEARSDLLYQIENTVRRVMGEMIQATPVSVSAIVPVDVKPEGKDEISDEDFDIADSFMNGL